MDLKWFLARVQHSVIFLFFNNTRSRARKLFQFIILTFALAASKTPFFRSRFVELWIASINAREREEEESLVCVLSMYASRSIIIHAR